MEGVVDVNMFDMAIKAAGILFDPERLFFLAVGVVLGLIIGVIPGLGGLVGLALLIPFTFDMDTYAALAVMMGLASVTMTGDTITAVLFGIPGTISSAATILDGYPMAKRGEAGRALGAGFTASVLGGLFGAALLFVSIPILRPIVLLVGSPELLAICLFGLSLVAVLSGGAVLQGLAAACIGLLVATTGEDVQTGELRWTFGTLYLWEGIPVVPVALGLFAIPELADLIINRKPIADDSTMDARKGQWQGVRDVFQNKFLMLRCAFIGAGLGSIPGIGGSVIDWVAYGHAARTEKNTENFGRGDVRGVIASESSNNAKEGGALVPTIAFGVPGSASMALLLGAFILHNIVPGPEMLTKRLDVTYTLVWSVAVANILGAGICFLCANQLAKIASVRIGILGPIVLSVVFLGAYQANRDWGDFYLMLGVGVLGWFMKRVGWPRPPMILGFVLGGLIENYMFISVQRYDWEWLYHPAVLIILTLTVYGVVRPLVRGLKRVERPARRTTFGINPITPDIVFSALVFAVFAAAFYHAGNWEFVAQVVPRAITGAGLVFTGVLLSLQLFYALPTRDAERRTKGDEGPVKARIFDITEDFEGLTRQQVRSRALVFAAWCLGILGSIALIGLLSTAIVFLLVYIRFQSKESWRTTVAVTVPVGILYWGLFDLLIDVHWPYSLLGNLFPFLRTELGIF